MGELMALTTPGQSVCVYCASSQACDAQYHEVAQRLGGLLAKAGWTVVYGGGRSGSMGALAEGALAAGGRVIGVIPRFMQNLEWGHDALSELHIVEDMRTRKHEMLTRVSAVIALAGGNMELGTIDAGGLFTAGTAAGMFANTVQATSGPISATASVTINAGALASITVTPNPVIVAPGGTQQFVQLRIVQARHADIRGHLAHVVQRQIIVCHDLVPPK